MYICLNFIIVSNTDINDNFSLLQNVGRKSVSQQGSTTGNTKSISLKLTNTNAANPRNI